MSEIINETEHNGIPVIEIMGDVGGSDTIAFRDAIQNRADDGADILILDLAKVTYLDSSWLGAFIFAMGLFDDNKKDLYFVITDKFVMDLFENSNLSSIANIVESLDDVKKP